MGNGKSRSSFHSDTVRAAAWISGRIGTTRVRREAVIGCAICGIVLAMQPDGSRAGLVHADGSSAADPYAMLDARSPGTRPVGALYQTKQRVAASDRKRPFTPEQRVLSAVRDHPIQPPEYLALDHPALPSFLRSAPIDGFPIVPALPFAGIPGPLIDPLPPFGVGSPGVPPLTQSPSAVPEPSTWLLLISGYAVLGLFLRRRSRDRRRATVEP